ncbi:MAG: hypothetical protein ACTSYI_15630 [Promethearchaeota archaeon]
MSPTDNWRAALKDFLDKTYQGCAQKQYEFVLVGSAATAMQNCRIQPKDIDILAKSPETVKFIADLMSDFEIDEFPSDDIDLWYSSKQSRVFIIKNKERNEMWHMARWMVQGVKIEVSYMASLSTLDDSHEAGYIWENGPDMYPHVKHLDFGGYDIGVVPLEIQLSSNYLRKLNDRVGEIARIFHSSGFNKNLLQQALTSEQYQDFLLRMEDFSKFPHR